MTPARPHTRRSHCSHAYIRGNHNVDDRDLPLRPQDYTFMEMLTQQAGYRTFHTGKWGLGWVNSTGDPMAKGFDYYYGQLDQKNCHNMYPTFIFETDGGLDSMYDPEQAPRIQGTKRLPADRKYLKQLDIPENKNASRDYCMSPSGQQVCRFTHDLWTNRTVDILTKEAKRQAADAAKGQETAPFFVYLSYTDPHAGGWQGTAESGNPVPSDGQFDNSSWPDVERDHASVIANFLDRDVGRIADLIDSEGLADNTLVLFFSDNGAHNEGGHDVHFFDSAGPFRGFKRSLYEGGVRSPGIARWTGTTPAGAHSAVPFAFWDFMPTVAELAGLGPAAYPSDVDGMSIAPTILGKPEEQKQMPPRYWEFCTRHSDTPLPPVVDDDGAEGQVEAQLDGQQGVGWGHAIRHGEWKAVSFFKDEPLQLYNLTADRGETNDVAAKFPDVVKVMEEIAKESHTDSTIFPVDGCSPSSSL